MATALRASSFSMEAAMEGVETVLREQTMTKEPLLTRMAQHVVFAGGKRLRPRLTLLAFGACGGSEAHLNDAVNAAAAFELVHTATLVHDDIIDQSPLRRGKPTLHTLHGMAHAIVAADFLFARAFGLAARLDTSVVEATEAACVRLAEGQILEQMLAGNPETTVESYMKVIANKTAEPLRACAAVGAKLARADPKLAESLGAFGLEVGIAFQIADDLLDITGKPEETGKPVGLDAKAGVLTLPSLLAMAPRSARPAGTLQTVSAPATLEATIAAARGQAEAIASRAVAQLDVLPPSPYRDMLSEFGMAMVRRRA
ncbi:MAG: polyprenyl synthetase family protein [Thermoplasmatota archaeon]